MTCASRNSATTTMPRPRPIVEPVPVRLKKRSRAKTTSARIAIWTKSRLSIDSYSCAKRCSKTSPPALLQQPFLRFRERFKHQHRVASRGDIVHAKNLNRVLGQRMTGDGHRTRETFLHRAAGDLADESLARCPQADRPTEPLQFRQTHEQFQ